MFRTQSSWFKAMMVNFVAGSVLVTLMNLQPLSGESIQTKPNQVKLFVYPEVLSPDDTLADGVRGKPIELTTETMMIWVDRMPGARFEHPTEYILISRDDTRIVKGGWWPVLNGKDLFRNGKDATAELPKSPE